MRATYLPLTIPVGKAAGYIGRTPSTTVNVCTLRFLSMRWDKSLVPLVADLIVFRYPSLAGGARALLSSLLKYNGLLNSHVHT